MKALFIALLLTTSLAFAGQVHNTNTEWQGSGLSIFASSNAHASATSSFVDGVCSYSYVIGTNPPVGPITLPGTQTQCVAAVNTSSSSHNGVTTTTTTVTVNGTIVYASP